MDFNKSRTAENLARAFATECMDGARYQFLAKTAHTEGYTHLEVLLKTAAKEEMSHAQIYWDLITQHGGEAVSNIQINFGYPFKTGPLASQLKYSSETEKAENVSLYPSFAKIAEDEGFKDIAEKFKLVALVESDHHLLMEQLYNELKGGTLYKKSKPTSWKCNICGHEETGKTAFKTCVMCGAEQGAVQIPVEKNKI